MRRLAASALAALTLGPAAARTEDGLADLLRRAEAHHPLLRGADTQVAAAAEGVAAARAEYRPSVVARAAAVATQRDARLQDGGRFMRDDTQQSASVALDQTLYDGGRRGLRTQLAGLRYRLAEARRDALVRDVRVAVAGDAFAYRAAEEAVRLNQRLVALLREDVRAVTARIRAGDATRTDLATTQSRLALARARLAASELERAVRRESLLSATGLDALPPLSAPEATCVLPGADEALRLAERRDPSLRAARLQRDLARGERALAGRATAPTLSLAAQASTARQVSPVIDENDELSVGLSLTVPLYQGGRARSANRRQALAAQAAALDEREARRQLALRLRQLTAQREASEVAVAAQTERLSAARQAAEGVRVGQGLGFYSQIEALNAAQDSITTEIDLATARADLAATEFALCATIGAVRCAPGRPCSAPAGAQR